MLRGSSIEWCSLGASSRRTRTSSHKSGSSNPARLVNVLEYSKYVSKSECMQMINVKNVRNICMYARLVAARRSTGPCSDTSPSG